MTDEYDPDEDLTDDELSAAWSIAEPVTLVARVTPWFLRTDNHAAGVYTHEQPQTLSPRSVPASRAYISKGQALG